MDIVNLLTAPLKPFFTITMVFVGWYSLTVNVKHEKNQQHSRAAKLAFIGGWCYIILGAGSLLLK